MISPRAAGTSYRRVLNGLVEIADGKYWSKKSYNNAISVLRRAFKFGYRDHAGQHDPARDLKGARMPVPAVPVLIRGP
jgi:site-specific recombinase XerD